MTTLEEDIQLLKRLEQDYVKVIEELEENRSANYGLLQDAGRKLARIKLKRLDLESRGLV